jgi:hypothetical protein
MENDWTEPVRGQAKADFEASSAVPDADYLGSEMERLARAMGRSNAQILIGATNLVSGVLANFNEAVLSSVLSEARPGDASGNPADSRDPAPVAHIEYAAARSAGFVEGVSEVLIGAVRDSASLLTRSVEGFLRAYDEELGRLWAPPPRQPAVPEADSVSTR